MVYLVQGPTASGKTSLAIELAKHLNTEIISADSRQFYQEMNIGTAKPNSSELAKVNHHFIDNRSIKDPMNVVEFQIEASDRLQDLLAKYGSAVVTGGSSQYVDALIYGIDSIPVFPAIQADLIKQFEQYGIEPLQQQLKAIDVNAFESIDIHNSRRLIRALEVSIGSGNSILSSQHQKRVPKFPFRRFFVQWEREDLYRRINFRVDQMISEGLEAEVNTLKEFNHLMVFNTVGYKEWSNYDLGLEKIEEVIIRIKQNSRNYAKRQLTWLNQYEEIVALNPYSDIGLLEQALSF